jgi:Methylase involved in ubiquinone/menaquinone biosynthesis
MRNFNEYMHRKNQSVYSDPAIVRSYNISAANAQKVRALQKPEIAILKSIEKDIINKKILDIGIGGGRTTRHLVNISSDYIGIDYSLNMINECKKTFSNSNIDLRVCDARNMSIFDDEMFDFILFSYNGIDYSSNYDRLLILSEVLRLLKPKGYFAFSTHNKNCGKFNKFIITGRSTFIKTVYHNIKGLMNYLRNRRYCKYFEGYSIINDFGLDYSLLTYYINLNDQVRQLREIGFKGDIKAYDFEGNMATDNCRHMWIYYCVRKN